ncbi:transposase [Candidatus Amesbacteria bacterium]|nr:transposase [Candidatus Amesbacteria bacterium]
MAMRQTPLVSGGYYHIFNRGVAKMPIFTTISDYTRALQTIEYYRFTNPPLKLSKYKDLSIEQKSRINLELDYKKDCLVDILSFVFMPNHFHFLLKQSTDWGVSKFVGQFSNSYTRYFNTKHNRVGPVFQGVFKAVEVESEEQLIHLSRYIHLNPYVSSLISKAELDKYLWSSLPAYLGIRKSFVDLGTILSQFSTKFTYRDFVFDHSDYAHELERVKHLAIDIED